MFSQIIMTKVSAAIAWDIVWAIDELKAFPKSA